MKNTQNRPCLKGDKFPQIKLNNSEAQIFIEKSTHGSNITVIVSDFFQYKTEVINLTNLNHI